MTKEEIMADGKEYDFLIKNVRLVRTNIDSIADADNDDIRPAQLLNC